MDYKEYVRECERIRGENEQLLLDFEDWLFRQDLSSKTVREHVANVAFYINEFLLYDDSVEARDGAPRVGMFLGYWFINKAAWASKTSIRANAASLKKFYQFMHEGGHISDTVLSTMQNLVKERMPEWLEAMDAFEAEDDDEWDELWDDLQ